MGDPLHAAVRTNLGAELTKHRNFRVHLGLDLYLAGQDFRPDLCLYPREPLDLWSATTRSEHPPTLAAEVVPAGQNVAELLHHVEALFAAGVKSCWLVTPRLHAVNIMLPDGRMEHHHAGVVTDPVTGVTADLDAVFS